MDIFTSILIGVIAILLVIISVLLPSGRSHHDHADRDELGSGSSSNTVFDDDSEFVLVLDSEPARGSEFELVLAVDDDESEFELTLDD